MTSSLIFTPSSLRSPRDPSPSGTRAAVVVMILSAAFVLALTIWSCTAGAASPGYCPADPAPTTTANGTLPPPTAPPPPTPTPGV